jgi:hypothetical protein
MVLLTTLTFRVSGLPMSHANGQTPPHRDRCLCLNCPGESQCCCKSAQSLAEAVALSSTCDQPLDGISPTSAKNFFPPTQPQTLDLNAAESLPLLPRSEVNVRPAFAFPLERPPQVT